MEYEIRYSDGYFKVALTGTANVDGFGMYFQELLHHPRWTQNSLVLLDETSLNAHSISPHELRSLAIKCCGRREKIGHSKFAVFTTSDLIFGFNRMFQAFAEDGLDAKISVFRTRDDALVWLN